MSNQTGNITLDSTSVILNERNILNDASFKANAGDVHCIIGPNGSGKSTLLRVLAGDIDVEGLTYEEVAEVLGIKLGTVRSRIHRGRSQLREGLAHRAPRGATRFSNTSGVRRS